MPSLKSIVCGWDFKQLKLKRYHGHPVHLALRGIANGKGGFEIAFSCRKFSQLSGKSI